MLWDILSCWLVALVRFFCWLIRLRRLNMGPKRKPLLMGSIEGCLMSYRVLYFSIQEYSSWLMTEFFLYSMYCVFVFLRRLLICTLGRVYVGPPPCDLFFSTISSMHLTMFNCSYSFRGLFCPLSVQISLTQNCLKLSISGFPYNLLPVSCEDIDFKKKIGSSIDLENRLQCAFYVFGSSCYMWQPTADSHGC
jgi:hypothetical protein